MEPKVSIIVPVYNAEEYLERCVDSILNQEFSDLELILVNDGSSDRSGEICRRWEEQDPRVRVISKENSGVSDSRNMALDQARGTYLQFVDSDDWLTPDATRLFVRRAEETGCDLVISDFYRVSGDLVAHKGDIEEDGTMTLEEFASHMMENPADFYYGVLWNKLYRRELVERCHLRMDRNISWCEDFMFNLEYMRHAESICTLRTPVYYYLKRKGSLVSQGMNITKTVRMKLMMFEYYNNFYKHILDEEDYEKNRLQVYRFLVDSAGDGIVLPSIFFSGSKRLGRERTRVSAEAVAEDSILAEAYRDRKLLEYYLEPLALRCGLSVGETILLVYLSREKREFTREELADLMNMSRPRLQAAIQKLSGRGMIRMEEQKEKKNGRRVFTAHVQPAACLLFKDFEAVRRDYFGARFKGFTQEERDCYLELTERIQENVRAVLRQPAAAEADAEKRRRTGKQRYQKQKRNP